MPGCARLTGIIAIALAAGAPLAAQQDSAARRPVTPAVQDTTQCDSTARKDTTGRDTLAVLVPRFPAPIPAGPLPIGARWTFTADSFLFSNVRTLADLLAHVPGVYVARGGFYGQAEIVLYAGRGPLSLEIYWDGVPYLPLGRDSVYVDPARISLAPLERVDVVVVAAALRVYLVTARQRSTATTTEVGILTGYQSIAAYRLGYQRRWRSGAGFSLVADWNTLDGGPGTSTTKFADADIWLEGQYVPNERIGASYQVLSSTWTRGEESGLVDRWAFKRRDGIFRAFLATRGDGFGPRLDLAVVSAAVSRDSAVATQTLWQNQLTASENWPRAHAELTARFASQPRPFQLAAAAAWDPVPRLTLAADARHAAYSSSRTGDRIHLSAGLRLPLGLSARGDLATSHEVAAPSLRASAAQRLTDVSGAVRWESPRLTVEIGGGQAGEFLPDSGFAAGIKSIGTLGLTPAHRYVTANASVRPVSGLELAGWYFHPTGLGGGDFEPPQHARLSAAFHSKFWRVFRSGVFDLRGEVAMESWSRGFGGFADSTGVPLQLAGATFVETNIEMRIAGVTIYYIIRNTNGMRASYVPGLGYPKRFQFYGVRWVFTN